MNKKNINIMKKIILISFLILMGLFSCKTNKDLSNVNKMDEIDLPFYEKDYKSDYIVGISNGVSPTITKSKDIALATSRERISNKLGVLVENVLESYSNQKNSNYVLSKDEQFSRQTSIRFIKNIKTLDEKVYVDKKGNFHYWVVLGINKDEMIDKVKDGEFDLQNQQVDIEKEEFREVFEKQIQKFSK